MLTLDGSKGEGGGQILRTALALSMVTRTPFRIEAIRAGRAKPGLLRQHLTAVRAAATICSARVDGAELGSTMLAFVPGNVVAGSHRFNVGSAGSATLVLQTVLPALITTGGAITIEGGTHNTSAPTFDFLDRVFLPILRRMGARVRATLDRYGFHPAGGGRITVEIEPSTLHPLRILERGAVVKQSARAIFAGIPFDVARRELDVVRARLGWDARPFEVDNGPGNVVELVVESEHATELFTSFGERGVRAEAVAASAIEEAEAYLAANVPVGPHLADQILLPMTLAGGGAFVTMPLTQHARTQIDVIKEFVSRTITCTSRENRVEVDLS